MIRKILYAAAALLIFVCVLLGAAVWYVRPAEPLDLHYEPISVAQKIAEMVKARKPELHISESELNDILKKELAARSRPRPHVEINGARFEQRANRVTAYLNLKTAGIPVGAAVDFELEWRAPDLIVRPTGTHMKALNVPASWLPLAPIVIPLDEALPPPIAIKQIRFKETGIVVSFGLN